MNGCSSYISSYKVADLRGSLKLGNTCIFLVYDLEAVKGFGSGFEEVLGGVRFSNKEKITFVWQSFQN